MKIDTKKIDIKSKRKHSERLVALFCILLVLVCTIAFCLPHSHCNYDIDCPICGAFRMLGAAFVALSVASFLSIGSRVCGICGGRYPCLWLMKEGTPVGLKVKLSD